MPSEQPGLQQDLWRRYKAALKDRFCTETLVVENPRQAFMNHLKAMPEHTVSIFSTTDGKDGGHAMLLYKEKGEFYFYDPNDASGEFFKPMKPGMLFYRAMRPGYAAKIEGFQSGEMVFKFEDLDVRDALRPYKSQKNAPGEKKSIPQSEVTRLLVMYFNTVYKPVNPVGASGMCYGLCLWLRELLVQSGSPSEAGDRLYSALSELKERADELEIDVENQTRLTEEQIKKLGENRLEAELILLFHSMQALTVSEEAQSYPKEGQKEVRKNLVELSSQPVGSTPQSRVGLPLSLAMEHRGGQLGVSNPISIYELLKTVSSDEIESLLGGLELGNPSSDQKEKFIGFTETVDATMPMVWMPKRLRRDIPLMIQLLTTDPLNVIKGLKDHELKYIVRRIENRVFEEICGLPEVRRADILGRLMNAKYNQDIAYVKAYILRESRNQTPKQLWSLLPKKLKSNKRFIRELVENNPKCLGWLPQKEISPVVKNMKVAEFSEFCQGLSLESSGMKRLFSAALLVFPKEQVIKIILNKAQECASSEDFRLTIPDVLKKDHAFVGRLIESNPNAVGWIADDRKLLARVIQNLYGDVSRLEQSFMDWEVREEYKVSEKVAKVILEIDPERSRKAIPASVMVRLQRKKLKSYPSEQAKIFLGAYQAVKAHPKHYRKLSKKWKSNRMLGLKLVKDLGARVLKHGSNRLKRDGRFMFMATLIDPEAKVYAKGRRAKVASQIAYGLRLLVSPWTVSPVSNHRLEPRISSRSAHRMSKPLFSHQSPKKDPQYKKRKHF